jgi:hypothetical protein
MGMVSLPITTQHSCHSNDFQDEISPEMYLTNQGLNYYADATPAYEKEVETEMGYGEQRFYFSSHID